MAAKDTLSFLADENSSEYKGENMGEDVFNNNSVFKEEDVKSRDEDVVSNNTVSNNMADIFMLEQDDRRDLENRFIPLHFNNADWMARNKVELRYKKLNQIKLVRAHQAITYDIDGAFDHISVCQDAHLWTQLIGGIRVIDIRPAFISHGRRIVGSHGPHTVKDIAHYFYIIKNFIDQHPQEFIIIELQNDGKFLTTDFSLDSQSTFDLIVLINKIFGESLITSKDIWFNRGETLLNDIWKYKKNIWIHSSNFILKSTNFNSPGISGITWEEAKFKGFWPAWSSQFSLFEAETQLSAKFIQAAETLKQWKQSVAKGYDSNYLLVSVSLQLTPAALHHSAFDLNKEIYSKERFYDFADKLLDSRINIIGLDFVFYNPQIVNEIINANFFKKNAIKFQSSMNLRYIIQNGDFINLKVLQNNYYLSNENGTLKMIYKDRRQFSTYFQFLIKSGGKVAIKSYSNVNLINYYWSVNNGIIELVENEYMATLFDVKFFSPKIISISMNELYVTERMGKVALSNNFDFKMLFYFEK